MDERIETIKDKILEDMPNRKILYQFSNGFHKFRIEGEGPTHWLYVSRELVSDCEPVILLNLVRIYRIAESFNNATDSLWLFWSSDGIQKVDENFTK